MTDDLIPARSEDLNPEDLRRRALVTDLIAKENAVAIEFAKNLVTVSLSAVGIILALKDKWLEGLPDIGLRSTWLAVAVGLLLVASLVCAFAMRSVRLQVSLADYAEVDDELNRVVRQRHHLTMAGMALIAMSVVITTSVAL
jgi:hypothetical protein